MDVDPVIGLSNSDIELPLPTLKSKELPEHLIEDFLHQVGPSATPKQLEVLTHLLGVHIYSESLGFPGST